MFISKKIKNIERKLVENVAKKKYQKIQILNF